MNKIEQLMKHHTKGGRMIRNYSGEKEYILKEDDMNEILELLKIRSTHYAVVKSKQLTAFCKYCESRQIEPKRFKWEEIIKDFERI